MLSLFCMICHPLRLFVPLLSCCTIVCASTPVSSFCHKAHSTHNTTDNKHMGACASAIKRAWNAAWKFGSEVLDNNTADPVSRFVFCVCLFVCCVVLCCVCFVLLFSLCCVIVVYVVVSHNHRTKTRTTKHNINKQTNKTNQTQNAQAHDHIVFRFRIGLVVLAVCHVFR